MNEELVNKINEEKEVLSIMPKNNVKNKKLYIGKLEELIKKYDNVQQLVLNEVKLRNRKLCSVNINDKIEVIDKKIKIIDNYLYLFNDFNSPYEKLGLDKLLYNLSNFQKENLEKINKYIMTIIDIFNKVGINLKQDDFKYSIYTYEYMGVYLKETNKKNGNSELIEECFENIYWQCPSIIVQIGLNFRYLYYSNTKLFEKYINQSKNSIDFDYNAYLELKKEYDSIYAKDTYILLSKFVQKELIIKDFNKEKVEKLLNEVVVNTDNVDNIINIEKLSYSLKEYNNYLDLKYIIDDIKKLYNEKEKYKDSLRITFKQISVKEKSLFKLNKKIFKIYYKENKIKKVNKLSLLVSNLLEELKELYKQLEIDIFNDKVYSILEDDSTMFDVFCLSYSYYNYFVRCMLSIDVNATDDVINNNYNNMRSLILNPYNTIINNITILDDSDIATIIKDKYKLMSLNILDSNLEKDNVKNFINTIDNLIIYNNINGGKLSINDIAYVCDSNVILDNNKA